jgi:hypothetical protein
MKTSFLFCLSTSSVRLKVGGSSRKNACSCTHGDVSYSELHLCTNKIVPILERWCVKRSLSKESAACSKIVCRTIHQSFTVAGFSIT